VDHSVELPFTISGVGRLYLWPKGRDGLQRFVAALGSEGLDYEVDDDEGRITVPVRPESFVDALSTLRGALSNTDLHDARVLLKSDDSPPTLADFSRADRLAYFVALSRGRWLSDILDEQRLAVAFQPIVDAQTLDRIDGYEALLRGVDRGRGAIAPARLLSAARDAGLVPELERQVHDLAASTVSLFEPDQRLFINMTPTTACHRILGLEALRAAVERWMLDPGRVVVELTECEQMPDSADLRGIVERVHEAGFALALDDLGAGFSNLNLIHELEPDIIKLDMALVRDIHRDRVKAAIAETTIDMAQQLGITVVAEGIEQIEEFAWIRARGVEYAQGFLLGRPQVAPDPASGGWPSKANDPYEDVDTLVLERLR
jgi:EAL domain-containing protein (putative c-di-GMP-specific phosphodiesterase class I)